MAAGLPTSASWPAWWDIATVTRDCFHDRDITNIILPAYVELTGRTVTEDGTALPHLSSAIMIEARPARGTTLTTAVRPGGAFRLMTPLQLDGLSELSEIRLTLAKGN